MTTPSNIGIGKNLIDSCTPPRADLLESYLLKIKKGTPVLSEFADLVVELMTIY